MNRLLELTLNYMRRDSPVRVLDAAAGSGAALVVLADEFWREPRYAELPDPQRAAAVLGRLRGADDYDHGAQRAIARWAEARGGECDTVVAVGEALAFEIEPVQGELFVAAPTARPPAVFSEGPFDVVYADVPRRELTAEQRDALRGRFDTVAGTFSGEVPFVERLLDLVVESGILAIRLRSAVVRREFGRGLVAELGRRTRILHAEVDGDAVLVVMRLAEPGDGDVLLRALGSESAARVLRALDGGAHGSLADHVHGTPGVTSTPGFDEAWEVPRWLESRVPTVPLVRGQDVQNWVARSVTTLLWPYDEHGERRSPPDEGAIAWLSRFRTLLEQRVVFGEKLTDRDVRWFEYAEHHPERWAGVPAIAIARTGTQPSVAIIREPIVVSAGALVLRPRPGISETFLAGVLASSAANFWMKQLFHVYPTVSGRAFEVTAAGLAALPIPAHSARVEAAAAALERAGRSFRPLWSAIEGEPERLGARLDGVHAANARLAEQLARLSRELDAAVLEAFGLAADDAVRESLDDAEYRWSPHPSVVDERDTLVNWLAGAISDGFASRELPVSSVVAADDVADWVRRHPLLRAVVARADVSVLDVLMQASVPDEADCCYSLQGLQKLQQWANGQPRPFTSSDYGGRASEIPRMSATQNQRRIWRWRGRFNVPRELFVHLVDFSVQRGRPYFAWAGAPLDGAHREVREASTDEVQVDLERLIQVQEALRAGPVRTSELADIMFSRGWTAHDVRVALEALSTAGRAIERGGRWRLC